MTKTSVHIGGGFWAHIVWNQDGSKGKDQRGRIWYNRHNPTCEHGWLKPMCEMFGNALMRKNILSLK